MDIESTKLFGKKIVTIRKAQMDSKGMNFHYNYFEDDVWENAGYNRERNHVWSNKIGWSEFHDAVVAAYTLEEQYTEGVAATMVNGKFVTSGIYVGWLNYLFDEYNHIKNFDAWKLFEAFYNSEDAKYYDISKMGWENFGNKRYAFTSKCEIYAVLYGIEEMMKKVEEIEKDITEKFVVASVKLAMEFLEKNKNKELYIPEDECRNVMNAVKRYCMQDEKESGEYEELLTCVRSADAPVIFIKLFADIFGRD